jgi:hypothetical protein
MKLRSVAVRTKLKEKEEPEGIRLTSAVKEDRQVMQVLKDNSHPETFKRLNPPHLRGIFL